MDRTRISLLAGGVFLLILVVTAPARLLGYLAPETLAMQGYRGSLWLGSANTASLDLGGGRLQLGKLDWDFSIHSLLFLSPRVRFFSEWGPQKARLDVSVSPTGSLRLRESSARFSADLIKHWVPVQLGGELHLKLQELYLRDGVPFQGEGQLVWNRAYWVGTTSSQRLGNYALDFRVTGESELEASITTLAGPVDVSGQLLLKGREYSVDLKLTSQRGFGEEISNALQLMAAPVADGYHLKFSSEI